MSRTSRTERYDDWEKRSKENSRVKEAIAEECLRLGLIGPYVHIFLDCGSTFVHLAKRVFKRIKEFSPITLSTTSAEIFLTFYKTPERDLIDFRLIGGCYVPYHRAFDGNSNPDSPNLRPNEIYDRAFLGVSTIDERLHLYSTITDVVSTKQQAARMAKEVVILCDTSKISKPSRSETPYGYLELTADGNIWFHPFSDDDKRIDARLVVGITDSPLPRWLAVLAEQRNTIKRDSVWFVRGRD